MNVLRKLLLPIAIILFLSIIPLIAMNMRPMIVTTPVILGWILVFIDHKIN